MNSFKRDFLSNHRVNQQLIKTIRLIGEYKGKQELFKQQSPQILKSLQDVAIIQSTDASNRIEGITAPDNRIKKIVARKTTPRNRSEQEIAGYREVLGSIHTNFENIPISLETIMRFHKELYQFMDEEGGNWKTNDNVVDEQVPGGQRIVRFRPVSARETPEAMNRLHNDFQAFWKDGALDSLLLIPTYVFDFLCIHPFKDGNGRVARLLTLLLLYKSGYEVGRYISLEHIVQRTQKSYYDALGKSSAQWHQGQHTLSPWWEYFLGVMLLTAYKDFEKRVGVVTSARGAKRNKVIDTITRLPAEFKYADIARVCPEVSRPTIKRVLESFRKAGKIECVKPGRDALWKKKSTFK